MWTWGASQQLASFSKPYACVTLFLLCLPVLPRLLQVVDVGRQVGRALDAAAAVEAAAAAAAAAGPKVISSRPNWKAQMGLQRQVGACGGNRRAGDWQTETVGLRVGL